MILTIDNLTGLGPIDYSAAIAADHPLKIARTLNKPSILSGLLDLSGHSSILPIPARRARVIATADNFTVLFTGYLAVEPVALYAGVTTTGAVYRYELSALSDEWLLDKQPLPLVGTSLATLAGTALRSFTQRTGGSLFTTTGVSHSHAIGVFEPSQTEVWSANAGAPRRRQLRGLPRRQRRSHASARRSHHPRPQLRRRCRRLRRHPLRRRPQDRLRQGTRQRRHPLGRNRTHRLHPRDLRRRRHHHHLPALRVTLSPRRLKAKAPHRQL